MQTTWTGGCPMIERFAILCLLAIIVFAMGVYLLFSGAIQILIKTLYLTKAITLVISCCIGLVLFLLVGYLVIFGIESLAQIKKNFIKACANYKQLSS